MSDTPKSNAEQIDREISRILADSVDSVDFWLKCDALAHNEAEKKKLMSQKKCRFCS